MRRILLLATAVALFATGTIAHAVPVKVERSAEKDQTWCMARTAPEDRAGLAGARVYASTTNITDRPRLIVKCTRAERRTVTKRWTETIHVAPEPIIAEPQYSESIVSSPGNYGGAPLSSIRACESTNNYSAISPDGTYRGAYQFDQQTWESVGGSGDPAAAPPAEQDARAARLYAERGGQPWPNC